MSLLQDDKEKLIGKQKELDKAAPFGVLDENDFQELRVKKEEGGVAIMIAPNKEMKKDSMPEEQEEDMLPDNEMEDEYLDFILDEA